MNITKLRHSTLLAFKVTLNTVIIFIIIIMHSPFPFTVAAYIGTYTYGNSMFGYINVEDYFCLPTLLIQPSTNLIVLIRGLIEINNPFF